MRRSRHASHCTDSDEMPCAARQRLWRCHAVVAMCALSVDRCRCVVNYSGVARHICSIVVRLTPCSACRCDSQSLSHAGARRHSLTLSMGDQLMFRCRRSLVCDHCLYERIHIIIARRLRQQFRLFIRATHLMTFLLWLVECKNSFFFCTEMQHFMTKLKFQDFQTVCSDTKMCNNSAKQSIKTSV